MALVAVDIITIIQEVLLLLAEVLVLMRMAVQQYREGIRVARTPILQAVRLVHITEELVRVLLQAHILVAAPAIMEVPRRKAVRMVAPAAGHTQEVPVVHIRVVLLEETQVVLLEETQVEAQEAVQEDRRGLLLLEV